MKISAKGRYGLAAMLYLGKKEISETYISLGSISNYLNISKIYLEQIFTSFKKSNLVFSSKGANGGYKLSRSIQDISVYDILLPLENSLFEKNKSSSSTTTIYDTVEEFVFNPLDNCIEEKTKSISLKSLVNISLEKDNAKNIMYYI